MNTESSLDQLKELHILYIEDDDIIRKNVADSLRYFFAKVITATSYDEALSIYDSTKIDVLFVDIELPGKNGTELVKTIRAKDQNILIVMVTAYNDKHYLMELMTQNIQYYLVKPVTLMKLKEALYSILSHNDTNTLALTLKEGVEYLQNDGIIRVNGKQTQLSKREKKLLNLLIAHKNHYVSYTMIENEVWHPDIMSPSALKSIVYNIRKKLPVDCIKTYSKEGYRFQCD